MSDTPKDCDTCRYETCNSWEEPCNSCGIDGHNNWQPKEQPPASPKPNPSLPAEGITLRDYLAGQALTGRLANQNVDLDPQKSGIMVIRICRRNDDNQGGKTKR